MLNYAQLVVLGGEGSEPVKHVLVLEPLPCV